MTIEYNTKYPTVNDLRSKAKKNIPRFAFEYLDGGCNEDVNLLRNTSDIRKLELTPYYLREFKEADTRTELFGHIYDSPFGIAPIGLQGLMWPNAPVILAKAAVKHNIPFVLSTVSTSSIEEIGKVTEGKFWFQLYYPGDQKIRNDVIDRAQNAGCRVLVLLCDVPVFGYRPRDIRNGLSMPPRMTIRNIFDILMKPYWAFRTLLHGKPEFATIKPYMPANLDLKKLGGFMNENFSGRLDDQKISEIRDNWKGKIVLKGVASSEDAEKAVKLGLDGIIVSNHGGRQLDAGQSTIEALTVIAKDYSNKIKIMMDSGLRSGPDIARTIAAGAEFTFLGRAFMYGVGALGEAGGNHTISILKTQFRQVMEQICCEKVADLPNHLVLK